MRTYALEELIDKAIGKIGTPERDRFEQKLREEIVSYHVGEAIKKARDVNNLTKEQLGERIGVRKAQISRLERGHNISLVSIIRVFSAMNIRATLELDGIGTVSLC